MQAMQSTEQRQDSHQAASTSAPSSGPKRYRRAELDEEDVNKDLLLEDG